MLILNMISFEPYLCYCLVSVVHKDVYIKRTVTTYVATNHEGRIPGISNMYHTKPFDRVFLEKISHHMSGLCLIIGPSIAIYRNFNSLSEVRC